MRRAGIIGIVALISGVATAQEQPAAKAAAQWFPVPADAVYTTGDTWTSQGETHRLYGVQACLRGTRFTNASGVQIDCGEAGLTMLVSLVRDLKPLCYTAGWKADTKTRYLVCVAQPTKGAGAGSRIDVGTALISTGWAFAAVNPDGSAVHAPYMVAQAVAKKQKAGLWQFPDLPDPNAIILRTVRSAVPAAPAAPAAPGAR